MSISSGSFFASPQGRLYIIVTVQTGQRVTLEWSRKVDDETEKKGAVKRKR